MGYAGERWIRVGDARLGSESPTFAPPLAIEARPGFRGEWLVLSAANGPATVDLLRLAIGGDGSASTVSSVPAMAPLLATVGTVYFADMARTLDAIHIGMTGLAPAGFVRTFQVQDELTFSTGRVSTQNVLLGPIAVSPGRGGGTARTYYYRRDAGGDRVAYFASDGGNDDRAWTFPSDRPLAAAQDFAVIENGGRFALWQEGNLTNVAAADGPTVKVLPSASATVHTLVLDGCRGGDPPPGARCGDVYRVQCSPACEATFRGRLAVPAPPGLDRFGVARMPGHETSLIVAHGVGVTGGIRVALTSYTEFEADGAVDAFDGTVFDRIDAIDLESHATAGGRELMLAVHGRTSEDMGGVYVQIFRYCAP